MFGIIDYLGVFRAGLNFQKRWMEWNNADKTVLEDKKRLDDDKRRDVGLQKVGS